MLVGAAGYGAIKWVMFARGYQSPNEILHVIAPVCLYIFGHAGWLCFRLFGWPRSIADPGVLFVNLAYFPLLFLLIRRISRALRRRRKDHAPRCPQCDYNLTGNRSGACPECGRVIEQDSLVRTTD